jgi:hypothetical protein
MEMKPERVEFYVLGGRRRRQLGFEGLVMINTLVLHLCALKPQINDC